MRYMKIDNNNQNANQPALPAPSLPKLANLRVKLLAGVMASLLAASALVLTMSTANAASAENKLAPALELRGKDADTTLGNFKAKLIYLDFWATWCAPCRYSFPWMEKMQEKYRDAGLVVVAVSIDGERQSIDRFLRDQKVSFTVVQDNHMHTANAYGVDAMPSTFFIGQDGKILYHHRGFSGADKNKLEQQIRDILLK